jgi:hypothetical protein
MPWMVLCTAVGTALRGVHRALRHFRGLLGGQRHLFHLLRHVAHTTGCVGDLRGLAGGRLGEFVRGLPAAFGGDRHLLRGVLDTHHQVAHLLHGEVDRVRDRARDLLGHFRLNAEIAVREVTHFIEQLENRVLRLCGSARHSPVRGRAGRCTSFHATSSRNTKESTAITTVSVLGGLALVVEGDIRCHQRSGSPRATDRTPRTPAARHAARRTTRRQWPECPRRGY